MGRWYLPICERALAWIVPSAELKVRGPLHVRLSAARHEGQPDSILLRPLTCSKSAGAIMLGPCI